MNMRALSVCVTTLALAAVAAAAGSEASGTTASGSYWAGEGLVGGAPVARALQQTWSLRSTTGPSARYYPTLAYDRSQGETVLFGGTDTNGWNGETWSWDGSTATWTLKDPGDPSGITAPSRREAHGMVYDEARGVVVLHGGWDGGADPETWTWNGLTETWTLVDPTSQPMGSRRGHAMAYDSARGVVVLFGGFDASSNLSGQTWEWNGTVWQLASTTGPSPRWLHGMAYDRDRGVTVLFGGYDGSVNLNDTWEWNGTNWTQVATTGPSPRRSVGMAYDEALQATILFGGYDGSDYDDTWAWNGTVWVEITEQVHPSARRAVGMTYDSDRGVLLLFGGNSDANGYSRETWAYGICPGDLNGDGFRNVTDFTVFAAAYGSQIGDSNYTLQADFNSDGFVNVTDFTQFAAAYGHPCP